MNNSSARLGRAGVLVAAGHTLPPLLIGCRDGRRGRVGGQGPLLCYMLLICDLYLLWRRRAGIADVGGKVSGVFVVHVFAEHIFHGKTVYNRPVLSVFWFTGTVRGAARFVVVHRKASKACFHGITC